MAVIAKQRYKLDIAPKGGWVIVYASQHDNGAREIEFEITNQGNAYSIPASINISVQGVKSNSGYFSHSCSYSGNIVKMALANDMTDVIGKAICVLKFTNSSQQKLATAKFILNVDTDSSSEGIIIDTEAEEIFNQMLNEIRAQASAISVDIAELQSMVGTPLVASTVSAMTNHNKIYVYTGSESGYTSGNWYYWNGSAWASGGVYNAVAFDIDSTPIQGSNNPVSSGGVYEQIEGIKEDLYVIGDASFISGGWINLGVGIGNIVNYTVNSNLGYSYAIIDCKAGDAFLISAKGGNNSRAWGFVDSADKLLSVANAGAYVSNQKLVAPSDGKLIVNAYVYDLNLYPYYLKYNIPKVDGLIDVVDGLQSQIAKNTNDTELVLPRTVYGVIGHEFNLYKENALLYGDIDSVADVKFISFINSYFETRTRFSGTPISTYDNYPQVTLFKNSIKERDSFFNLHFIVKDPSILNGLTRDIVVIGDSKVAGGRLPQVLKILCENAGMTVGKLKGSIYAQNFDTYHEGRAGWSSADYFTSGRGDVTNAFYNNGTFDFSYWMTQQGYSHMDYVFINLGTNDYARTNALGSLEYIDTFIRNINAMIASIHAYDSTIKIIIGLAEGVCTYKWSSDRDDYLRNLNTRARLLNKASIAEWDTTNKQNNNIWTCPIYLSMDMGVDYRMEEVPLSEWDSYFSTGKTRNNVLDTMHQNAVGYAKNATYMFSLLTYIESLNT